MIKLNKQPEPNVLQVNKDSWTDDYLAYVSRGESPPDTLKYKYREKEIKDQLVLETHGKCAYCESKIRHVSPGDIEHIIPKSKQPELIFEWGNLTLSCEECNRKRKRDYHNPSDPLINPYIDDPRNHLRAAGPMILHKPGDRKGEITKILLELNRPELFERRKERLENVLPLADKWATEQSIQIRRVLREQLLIEGRADKEYSFVVREFINSHCGL